MLRNADVKKSLSMTRCLEMMEIAYRELGSNRAANIPRCDILSPMAQEGIYHALKTMSGSVPALGAAAVRVDSDLLSWPVVGETQRRVKLGATDPKLRIAKENGLVIVYQLQTGEPVALMQDGVIQTMRVAATTALAAKFLSKEDSAVLGVLGSGPSGRAQVEAVGLVRPIKQVKVYSPTKGNRASFASWVNQRFQLPCESVNSPEGAVCDADIILCVTNSMDPIYLEKWMVPGVHVSTVRNGEVEEGVIKKANHVFLNWNEVAIPYPIGDRTRAEVPEFTTGDYGRKFCEGAIDWARYPLLSDLVTGKAEGRKSDSEITCFLNNIGIGVQFAAAGWAAYESAKAQGIGTEIPDDWLLQKVEDL